MSGSRTVQVLKRDGSWEAFDARKLAGAMCKAIAACDSGRPQAQALAMAGVIGTFLQRRQSHCVSSAAIFEMAVKVLRGVNQPQVADAFERHHSLRSIGRRRLRVRQDNGRLTCWDKSWLAKFAARSWELSTTTGRMIAGRIEARLLEEGQTVVMRRAVLDEMNAHVASLGLADAVPVRQYALE